MEQIQKKTLSRFLLRQNEGFNSSCVIGFKPSDYSEQKYLKVTKEVWQKLQAKKLMWKNGNLVENKDYVAPTKLDIAKKNSITSIRNQIIELKKQLANTDYQAIKYAEGELTAKEFAPIKEQRKNWRAEINALEEELVALKDNN